jgi:recombination protein RecT
MATENTKLKGALGAGSTTTLPAQQAQKPKTIGDQINALVPQMAKALPAHMNAERLGRIALTVFRQTPGLAECTQESFFGALMLSAQLGLEPGPLGQAYLVPFNNRKTGKKECQFIPGYKGMLDLVRRSGEVIGVPKARLVYANDLFELEYGLETDTFRHVEWHRRADGDFSEGGKLLGGYVQLRYKTGGGDVFFTPMSQVEKHRAKSASGNSGPWQTDFEAMVLKTIIRANWKWMPVSIEYADVQNKDGAIAKLDIQQLEDKGTVQVDYTVINGTGEVEMTDAEKEEIRQQEIKAAGGAHS